MTNVWQVHINHSCDHVFNAIDREKQFKGWRQSLVAKQGCRPGRIVKIRTGSI